MLNVICLNPFIRKTSIQYKLSEPSNINLKVYDMSGHVVRNLVSGAHEPGYHMLIWDGKDDMSHKINAGVYFVQLETEDYKFLKAIRFE